MKSKVNEFGHVHLAELKYSRKIPLYIKHGTSWARRVGVYDGTIEMSMLPNFSVRIYTSIIRKIGVVSDTVVSYITKEQILEYVLEWLVTRSSDSYYFHRNKDRNGKCDGIDIINGTKEQKEMVFSYMLRPTRFERHKLVDGTVVRLKGHTWLRYDSVSKNGMHGSTVLLFEFDFDDAGFHRAKFVVSISAMILIRFFQIIRMNMPDFGMPDSSRVMLTRLVSLK